MLKSINKNSANGRKCAIKPKSEPKPQNVNEPDSSKTASVNLATDMIKNTILISIGDKKTQTLVDSGASISCASKSFLSKTNIKIDRFAPSDISAIVGVGNTTHSVLGTLELPFKISGITISHKFYILEQLNHAIILGQEFMEKFKAKLDFDSKLFSILDDTVVASLITTEKGLARISAQTLLEPGHMSTVKVKISRRKNNETVLLEPLPNLQKLEIAGAKCLVKIQKQRALINMINPTNKTIELTRGP